MEPGRSGSFGSLRRRSLSSRDNDFESESVSEAGDIGDRALHSNRYSGSGRVCFVDDVAEIGGGGSFGFQSHDPTSSNNLSPLEIISPLSTDAIILPGDDKKETANEVPWLVEYVSCLIHLAFFGILGAYTRYLLQKLFGPGVVGATSAHSFIYPDLPSNMVGSFLMGWAGIVYKGDIIKVSDQLAIGLTTGYLGSVTTFSGWNQAMIELSVEGQWVYAGLGILIGLFLVSESIRVGIETAKGAKCLLERFSKGPKYNNSGSKSSWKVDTCKRHLAVVVVLLVMLGVLYGVNGALEKREFNHGGSKAQLWLGCMVAPLGVWIRWYLARLNGRGLGKSGLLKWVPFGTLIANVSASCVMAALATTKKVVKTRTCDTVASGIQFGLLGCLSTVSTFIAEFHAMRESDYPWRAFAYAAITILPSFTFATLIYSVPVWTMGYN